jgi:SAM-dependent methyltransferase
MPTWSLAPIFVSDAMNEPNRWKPFDEHVVQYDAWFESESGRIIFSQELACLRMGVPHPTGRWLEIGVGTGRFAAMLGLSDGVDPSSPMRAMAVRRGIRAVDAVGESLPYPDRTFDGALMTTTLCFLSDPGKSFGECHRVLKDAGRFVIGLIPADSPWGRRYARKSADGHPIYSAATFHSPEDVLRLARGSGFEFQEAWSCLLTPPEALTAEGPPRRGIVPDAGFVTMEFMKRHLAEGLAGEAR